MVRTENPNTGCTLKSPVKIKIYSDAPLWAPKTLVQGRLGLNSHVMKATHHLPSLGHALPLTSIHPINPSACLMTVFGCLKAVFRFASPHPTHGRPHYQGQLGSFQCPPPHAVSSENCTAFHPRHNQRPRGHSFHCLSPRSNLSAFKSCPFIYRITCH